MEGVAVEPSISLVVEPEAKVSRAAYQALEKERDAYRKAFELAKLELERLRRRMFGQKAERVDPAQIALAFAAYEKALADVQARSDASPSAPPPDRPKDKPRHPHGRRPLDELELPEVTVRLDPPEGVADVGRELAVDVSHRIEYVRAHYVRLRIERARFVVPTEHGTTVVGTPMPDEMIPGGLAGPGLLAHVLVSKYGDHLPFHRQEEILARGGFSVSRGTMCRWSSSCHELAQHIVEAMRNDALERAHVIATDATGLLVQHDGACKKGHFWVSLADRDHVFFRYTPKHTSEEPKTLFKGFQGVLQADASSVYDALFRDKDPPVEAGCWAHARRKFFESVRSFREPSQVALGFIGKLFEVERAAKEMSPAKRLALRRARSRPVLDALRAWVDAELRDPIVAVAKEPYPRALRYLVRHWDALTRFCDDGHVRLDNNPSELALRHLVVGRKNWLFVGSDDGAHVTATWVSLLASCKLHGLDPEAYLRDLFRVLPMWPKTRLLELSPLHWKATRARLDPDELAAFVGPIVIPPVSREERDEAEAG